MTGESDRPRMELHCTSRSELYTSELCGATAADGTSRLGSDRVELLFISRSSIRDAKVNVAFLLTSDRRG